MQKFSPSILSLNLIPLGDLSGQLKGAFSQEEINSGFFSYFLLFFAQKSWSLSDQHHTPAVSDLVALIAW
jgi:hypothetical protein